MTRAALAALVALVLAVAGDHMAAAAANGAADGAEAGAAGARALLQLHAVEQQERGAGAGAVEDLFARALSSDYSSLAPVQAARALRACMAARGVLVRDGSGKQTGWAGQLIHSVDSVPRDEHGRATGPAAMVVGPLIPKASSTTLRKMHGHSDRPPGLTGRATPKPAGAFQLAAVRNPVDHFIAGYKQNGLWFNKAKYADVYPLFPHKHADPRFHNMTIAELYCSASDEERRESFAEHVRYFVTAPFERRDEHHVPQLHWLQNYVANETGSEEVKVIDAVDALVRLERFGRDWIDAMNAAKPAHPAAAAWMHECIQAKAEGKDHAYVDDDRMSAWKPMCGEDGSARYYRTEMREHGGKFVSYDVAPDGRAHIGYTAVALGQLHHHYALKYIGEHIHTLCNYLVNDFVCLRYAMPAACQLQRPADPMEAAPYV